VSGIGRSLRLYRAFRREQEEPERFYRLLAEDSVAMVSRFVELEGVTVLDVGGGAGWFAETFQRAGAHYVLVERGVGELCHPAAGLPPTVLGDGAALPFADSTLSVVFSSNVLEHVAAPWQLLDDLVRVLRSEGVLFVAFTNWYSPWGGHETSPWHFLGGERAALRYERRHGRPPKNRYGSTLYPVHVGQMLRWARHHPDVEIVDARPRYYPDWCRLIVTVPGLREVASWNVATVLRRR
jgi:SAM-dependent methyltransferase